MKFLLITGAFPPADKHGGTATTNYFLARALQQLGHEVFVLTTNINGEEHLDLPAKRTTFDGIPVHYAEWIPSCIPYHSLELARVLQSEGHRFDIALIASCWTGYGVLAGTACRRIGLPYIMYAHGSYDPIRLARGYLKKLFFWHLFDKRLYAGAVGAIALTRFEQSQMQERGIQVPIKVVPNGVEVPGDDFLSRLPLPGTWYPEVTDAPYFLFLGRIEQIKGIDMLLRGFCEYRRSGGLARLVLAGPGERGYRERMESLADELGIRRHVAFPGLVSGDGKASLLRNAEAFLLTSYGEGLPMAILEALAHGTPAIVSRECYVPEVGEEKAGMVVVNDPTVIARAMHEIRATSQIRQEYGKRARTLAMERFSWTVVAQETVDYCKSLIEAGSCITPSSAREGSGEAVSPYLPKTHGKIAETFSLMSSWLVYQIWKRILDHHRIVPTTVLDLGCGPGNFLTCMGRWFPNSLRIGYDIEEDLLVFAAKRKTGSSFLRGNADRLPFRDGTFDLVTSFQVIEHVMEPERMLAEIVRTLQPGGLFIFTTPNPECFSAKVKKSRWHGFRFDHISLRPKAQWEEVVRRAQLQLIDSGTTFFRGTPVLDKFPFSIPIQMLQFALGWLPWNQGESAIFVVRKSTCRE